MILNKEDIYDNIESFRNRNNYSLEKMAELTGMNDKSAYLGMIKNKRMKLQYLINLVNNTELSIEQIFSTSTNSQQKRKAYENKDTLNSIDESKLVFYTCPDCILREKKIEELKNENLSLIKELRETNKKYIDLLENSLGKKTG